MNRYSAASMGNMPMRSEDTTRMGEREYLEKVKKRLACVIDSRISDMNMNNICWLTERAYDIRQHAVRNVVHLLQKCKSADICFVIDATSSMSGHIDGVKNSISKLVKDLVTPKIPWKPASRPLDKLRVSCIAYRDHCDFNHFEFFYFSENIRQFERFLGGLNATGGGDPPEDVLGGLWMARSLDWSADSGVRLIFHIGDYPPHGNQFHDGSMGDSYPFGHPSDQPVEMIFKWMEDESINYCFGKITNYTNKMIAIFASHCSTEFAVYDVENPFNIADALNESISATIDSTIAKTKAPSTKAKLRVYKIKRECPDWKTIKAAPATIQSFKMPESIQDIIDDKPLVLTTSKQNFFEVAPNPFAEGKERIAFYARNVTTTRGKPLVAEELVCKEFKHVGKSELIPYRYELLNELQTVSSFLAFEFSKAIAKVDPKKTYTLKFLKVQTLKFIHGTRLMTAESKFVSDTNFFRFQNNAGYAVLGENAKKAGIDRKFVDLVMAFSHWTYSASRGFLMVVDLEGIVSKRDDGKTETLLTDPAIHCRDLTRFGSLNLGETGMQMFFDTHQCKKYCKLLKLPQVQ